MLGKRQLTAAVLSGVIVLTLATPALGDECQYNGRGYGPVSAGWITNRDSNERDNNRGNDDAMQPLIQEYKASAELESLEERVSTEIVRALQNGDYDQVKTALSAYEDSIDEISGAGTGRANR